MNQFKKITNQELLKELESRLTGFTQNEFATLMVLLQNHQQQVMEIIQADNPQVYQWIQEKHQQLEQEKTDKKIESLKKSLADKKPK